MTAIAETIIIITIFVLVMAREWYRMYNDE